MARKKTVRRAWTASDVRELKALAKKKIGVAQPDRTADFYHGFINSVHQEADKLGYEILESFSGRAPEDQMQEINAWIAAGVDALVVLPTDPNALGALVAKCKKQGIVFIGYANVVSGADGYIIKSAFDERGLLSAIERLLGSRQ